MTRRPMTDKIWASCPRCGYVEVRVDQISLHEHPEPVQNMYRFRCPTCSSVTARDANPGVVMLLQRCGVAWEHSPRSRALDEHIEKEGERERVARSRQGLFANLSIVVLAMRLNLGGWDQYCCPLESLIG